MKWYNYDKEVDIFTLSKAFGVKHSVEVGDFIIDFDKDNLVVGVEVLEASEHLGALDSLKNASMSVNYKPGSVYITLSLSFQGREKDVTIPLIAPFASSN